jgi:hypothetical protein
MMNGICCAVLALAACSPRKMGISRMADALSSTATTFSRDDDPEFVRLAAPSTLKMVEMLLDDAPSHPGLLMTACSGFTGYAYGFLQVDAEMLDPAAGSTQQLKSRGTAMYARGRAYCGRALEVRHAGAREALARDVRPLLASTDRADVPALYWTAVAWGGELSLSDNQLMRVAELGTIRAILGRALELDEGWQGGAIHEALIGLDGLPLLFGGNAARARAHFDRAVELSNGKSAFAYVAMAASVAQPAGDRTAFERLLTSALAIEGAPSSLKLPNLIAQKRAKFLLSRIDRLFPAERSN